MAQKRRVARPDQNRSITPLDEAGLERLALRYVERYATTRAKLASYLRRKLRERGWHEASHPPVERIVERFADLRYVDDRQFAEMRAASLARRGYGRMRVGLALRHAGIEEADAAPVLEQAEARAIDAALAFARRRRIGPYAAADPDEAGRRRAFAAMVRAGHSIETVKVVLAMRGEDLSEQAGD